MASKQRKFIRHPSELPIHYHRKESHTQCSTHMKDVGLGGICFECEEPIAPGTILEVAIPAFNDTHRLRGQVVWSHKKGQIYETGLNFATEDDAFRARMVEQICHIEAYRKQIKTNEGRELSSERAAKEWIEKFAAGFPS